MHFDSLPTDEDIKDTVFSIDKDSVAGLDGFSSAFYQACWEFIAIGICEAVKDFFCGTPKPRSFTATTIVLIPKKTGLPHRFITLIKHAIQTGWFTVLVNGEAAGFLKSSQGLETRGSTFPSSLYPRSRSILKRSRTPL
ncbi:UNVERIFIED_CONTAM: hypothetical protein Sindi_2008600 [Sesamum indicum]